MPPFLLWTLWRSGTHWLSGMLAHLLDRSWRYYEARETPEAVASPETYGESIPTFHIRMTPEQLLDATEHLDVRIVVLYRDPRDVLASNVNMRKYVEGYRDGLPPFPDMSFQEILDWEKETYGHFFEEVLPSWAEVRHYRVYPVTYEALRQDPTTVLTQLAQWLKIPTTPERVDAAVKAHAFNKDDIQRQEGEEDKTAHNRKGIVGDWRNQFSPAQQEDLFRWLKPTLERMGYI